MFDWATGVDGRGNKPESVVALLGGNVRAVFALATAVLAGGAGLLFWLLQVRCRGRWLAGCCRRRAAGQRVPM